MIFKKFIALALLGFFIAIIPSEAQIWNKVQKKLENKANEKVDDLLSGKKNTTADSQSSDNPSNQPEPYIEEVYSFVPGDSIIFESDFKGDSPGRIAKKWKSSGSGSVTSISGIPGNWLALSAQSTYKIDSLFQTPENFTVEFDLILRSSETSDIGSMSFGFARDNSAKNQLLDAYNDNAITNTQLHFHNGDITTSSSDTEIYNSLDYPFANYSNGLIHVAITVEGETMLIFVNKTKVVDTKMFKKDVPKNFYITAPFSYDQESKAYFGNFVMATD